MKLLIVFILSINFGNLIGDQGTLRDCAAKGTAKMYGGGTIKCEVLKD